MTMITPSSGFPTGKRTAWRTGLFWDRRRGHGDQRQCAAGCRVKFFRFTGSRGRNRIAAVNLGAAGRRTNRA